MNTVKSVLVKISQKLSDWRVNREIFHRVFPHLNRVSNHNYPFSSDEELERLALFSELDAKLHLELIERRAEKMPKAYGDAFRYIAYRDLNARMKMYLEIAEHRVQLRDKRHALRCSARVAGKSQSHPFFMERVFLFT